MKLFVKSFYPKNLDRYGTYKASEITLGEVFTAIPEQYRFLLRYLYENRDV